MLEQAALESQAVSTPAVASAHLESDRLQELSEGCLDFEHELLDMFLKDSRQHLEQLRQAISQQNLVQIYQHAHHLKGSSANIGAKRIRAIAHELESQSSDPEGNSFEQWQHYLTELEFSWQQIQKIIWAQYADFAER